MNKHKTKQNASHKWKAVFWKSLTLSVLGFLLVVIGFFSAAYFMGAL